MNKPEPPIQKDYVPAREAIGILDVREQTLYAYVSRGWIRSIRQPGRKDRLYLREDIEKLRRRSLARSGHGVVAASAMNWGEPIIPSSITEITPDGPRYRGRLALDLARGGASFEAVAELLWSGEWHEEPPRWRMTSQTARVRNVAGSMAPPQSNDQLMETFALIALQLGMSRGSVEESVHSGAVFVAAREIIQTFTGCFGYISDHRRFYPMQSGQTIAEGLLRALALDKSEENRLALEAMLVLFADHELTSSTFAARVTASSGSTLHSCITSAICANSGVHIGRLYNRVDAFLARASGKELLLRRARQLQERGSAVPGFGHPLYPEGDPRALLLLDIAKQRKVQSKRLEAIYGFVDDAQKQLGLYPRQELAVLTLAIAMGLPERSAGAIVTLSRTAGWVAHVQEQRLSGQLLRPRAKLVVDHG
ncbi:MAG: citrate synthase [Burkholderia sp.]|nr:citrate synthase [Burkholderia sp.]